MDRPMTVKEAIEYLFERACRCEEIAARNNALKIERGPMGLARDILEFALRCERLAASGGIKEAISELRRYGLAIRN